MGSYAQADASKSWLPVAQVPGAEAYRSGETVHIRLSNANLFDAGSATLKRGAHEVLDRVASAVRQNYPNQLIGIEGHTDGDPIRKSKWKSNHELSVQRALAVYEYLRQSGSIPESQLFVAGYGPNLPIAANSNNQGKAQNRRVELVVRPESAK
jgi:chemotaxis protein MotB